MKKMTATVFCLFAFHAFAQTQLHAPLSRDQVVVRAFYEDVSLVRQLSSWRELWSVDRQNQFVVLDVTPVEMDRLTAMGFVLDVDEDWTTRLQVPIKNLSGQQSGIPGFPCYLTVVETFTLAQSFTQSHPNLAEWIDIGDSWEKTADPNEGFDIRVLKLTNRSVAGDKPKLFAMTAIHAREYATAGLSMRFAEHLIDNYGIDADITWLLDYHEIHLLLQANPDGRIRAETGLFWRKNADNDFCTETNSRGIDLNRNFDFFWGCCNGSSTSPCSETFRGPSAGSEPEIQAVQDYIRSIFPDQREGPLEEPAPEDATGVFLDIHAAGGLVIWPYGLTTTQPGNAAALQSMGRKLAFPSDYFPEPISQFVIADGSTVDFAYGELGVAAYGFEVGTSFFQDCQFFEQEILPDNLAALIYAAKSARTPYLSPSGPDSLNLTIAEVWGFVGQTVRLTATIDDTRFNNNNGTEPTQIISAAEVYIDVPPWETQQNPVAFPLQAVDGNFDSLSEAVMVDLDTSSLSPSKHILYLRGRDAGGSWGVVSAIFLELESFGGLLPTWPEQVSILDLIPLL